MSSVGKDCALKTGKVVMSVIRDPDRGDQNLGAERNKSRRKSSNLGSQDVRVIFSRTKQMPM